MRRIKSADDLEKSKKRNAWILGMVLIGLLILSTAGYALFSGGNIGSSQIEDNFTGYNGNYYTYQSAGIQFYFVTPLETAKGLSVDIQFDLSDYYGQKVYFVSDNEKSWNEISTNLASVISGAQMACYGSCSDDLPEKTCDEKLIIWRDADQNRVYQQDQCIFIDGDISAVDAFIYKLAGIS